VIELALIVLALVTTSSRLETKLPSRVTVECGHPTDHANLLTRTIALRSDTCRTLLRYKPRLFAYSPSPLPWSTAAHILYHEWWHVQHQTTDEFATDCGAFSIYRQMLRRVWHVSKKRAQALYMEVWRSDFHYSPLPCKP
jgi:hypothetical protein